MLAFFVHIFSFHQSNLQILMFILSSWYQLKLPFFYNYNLFRRVLPCLTQRVGVIECQIMIFRSSYSYSTLGISRSPPNLTLRGQAGSTYTRNRIQRQLALPGL